MSERVDSGLLKLSWEVGKGRLHAVRAHAGVARRSGQSSRIRLGLVRLDGALPKEPKVEY
jgi:hypothetical protein